MFKDEVEEALKLFENSKARLEESEKEAESKDNQNETLDKSKSKAKMRRIVLNIVKKQTEQINVDIDKGDLVRAEGRRILIEKLIPNLKPKA